MASVFVFGGPFWFPRNTEPVRWNFGWYYSRGVLLNLWCALLFKTLGTFSATCDRLRELFLSADSLPVGGFMSICCCFSFSLCWFCWSNWTKSFSPISLSRSIPFVLFWAFLWSMTWLFPSCCSPPFDFRTCCFKICCISVCLVAFLYFDEKQFPGTILLLSWLLKP